MSEISARASRRAFCLGSCTRNGFTARNGPVLRCNGIPPAAGAAGGTADGATGVEAAGAAGAGGRDAGADRATGEGTAISAAPTPNTLPHTAQRARTPPAGTLAGSTRYTVSHDGQATFTSRPRYRTSPASVSVPGSGS